MRCFRFEVASVVGHCSVQCAAKAARPAFRAICVGVERRASWRPQEISWLLERLNVTGSGKTSAGSVECGRGAKAPNRALLALLGTRERTPGIDGVHMLSRGLKGYQ